MTKNADMASFIKELETKAEELRRVAVRSSEAYQLIKKAAEALKGEEDDDDTDETGEEADASMPAGGQGVLIKGYEGMPHEGLPSWMVGVRGGSGSSPQVEDGGSEEAEADAPVKEPEPKPQKPKPKRKYERKGDQEKTCEVCGKPFLPAESGHRDTCCDGCEKVRKNRIERERARRRRRDETSSLNGSANIAGKDFEQFHGRGKFQKKLDALKAEGKTYAEAQKADSIERFARVDLGGGTK